MLKEYPENKALFGEHPLFPRTPLREWIRLHTPSAKDGYVAEDLDLIFLRYGKAIGKDRDADGQFILCEWKMGKRELPYPQRRVFGLIDRLLRLGDTTKKYYQGFYYINWDGKDNNLLLNGQKITQQGLQMFLMGDLFIRPFNF